MLCSKCSKSHQFPITSLSLIQNKIQRFQFELNINKCPLKNIRWTQGEENKRNTFYQLLSTL